MSQIKDFQARLNTMSGNGSWDVALWVVLGLALIAVAGVALMYYRDWQIQKAWRRRPKAEHAAKPGSRTPGLTLAEVRRAKQAARIVTSKGDTGMIPT